MIEGEDGLPVASPIIDACPPERTFARLFLLNGKHLIPVFFSTPDTHTHTHIHGQVYASEWGAGDQELLPPPYASSNVWWEGRTLAIDHWHSKHHLALRSVCLQGTALPFQAVLNP